MFGREDPGRIFSTIISLFIVLLYNQRTMKSSLFIRIFLAVSFLTGILLIISGFSTHAYLNTQTAFRTIATQGESPAVIAQACGQLHQPYIVQSFSVLLAITLSLIILGFLYVGISILKKSIGRRDASWLLIMTVMLSAVFTAIQIWEPDYLLGVCHL
jgi:hypothetical protein